MLRHITGLDVTLPAQWVAWRPQDGSAEADRVLTELGATGVDEARGRRELTETAGSLVPGVGYAAVAAWAPSTARGRRTVLATVVVEQLAGTETTTDPAGQHLRRTRRAMSYGVGRGRITFHEAALVLVGGSPAVRTRRTVPAGRPAGQTGVRTADALLGPAREEVLLTLFPPGSQDAVELRLGSSTAAGLDLAEDQVPLLAAGLAVRLSGG